VDDGGLHRDRHRAVDSGRYWGRRKTRAGAGLLLLPRILAVSRSFQEIILAIFFVKLFGFGPFAAASTLAFATIGFYGKLLAEDIEIWTPASEAVRATGAGWLQWINYGVQPQVMPRMIGLGLYRFDINFRESAVVASSAAAHRRDSETPPSTRYEFDSAAAILLSSSPS